MKNTGTPSLTPTAVAVRYGLLTGLASIILSFVLFLTEADQTPIRWLGLLFLVGGMVWAHREFKRANGGFMEYSQGLTIGAVMGLVAGAMGTVFNYIYMTFIDADYTARMMEATRSKMEDQGNMSDAQIDQALAMMQKFSSGGWMLVFGLLGSLLFGFLIALVVSAFTKHARPEFE
jgi:cbb3-type cytochrome oxidase subunit 3